MLHIMSTPSDGMGEQRMRVVVGFYETQKAGNRQREREVRQDGSHADRPEEKTFSDSRQRGVGTTAINLSMLQAPGRIASPLWRRARRKGRASSSSP